MLKGRQRFFFLWLSLWCIGCIGFLECHCISCHSIHSYTYILIYMCTFTCTEESRRLRLEGLCDANLWCSYSRGCFFVTSVVVCIRRGYGETNLTSCFFFETFGVVCKRRSYGEANLGVVFFLWFLLWCISFTEENWRLRLEGVDDANLWCSYSTKCSRRGWFSSPPFTGIYIYILYVYTYYPISICSHIVTSNVFNVLSGGWPGGAKLGLLGSGLAGKPSPWHP